MKSPKINYETNAYENPRHVGGKTPSFKHPSKMTVGYHKTDVTSIESGNNSKNVLNA